MKIKRKIKTETSGMEWISFLALVEELKRDREYKFSLLIAVGCYCGLRISDILSLKWIDLVGKEEMIIQEKKTGKLRNISINPALRELIIYVYNKMNALEVIRGEGDFIFSNRWGSKLSIQYTNRKLHSIFIKYSVKVKNGSSHTLRKTFGRRVWEVNGKSESSLILLNSIFQQNSISCTRRYIGLIDEQVENAYLNL